MRLMDFSVDSNLNGLREKMKASYSIINWDSEWNNFNSKGLLEKLKSQQGVDVDLSDVNICDDGTFEYAGEKVLVYIREQYLRYGQTRSYKFHVSNCSTIRKASENKSNSRYVISSRTDGTFLINLVDMGSNRFIEEGREEELDVCKNCLSKLNYKGYESNKTTVYREFSLEEFFEKYPGKNDIIRGRYRRDHSAPHNLYPADFDKIALRIKESRGYKCESCNLDMSQRKKFLDAHHVDRDKSNSSPENIKLLCVSCHSDQPNHSHMKVDRRYLEFTRLLN